MNSAFAAVRAEFITTGSLTHTQKVTRLYRHSLKAMMSWAIDRQIINEEATKIRARFDANTGAGSAAARRILREGEEELATWVHPDKYTIPWMAGGSKFMRNSPPPYELVYQKYLHDPAVDPPMHEGVTPDQIPVSMAKQPGKNIADFSSKTLS